MVIKFKMERPDLVKVGDIVEVEESQLITLQGIMCYYTIIPAVAMSNNIHISERLENLTGKIIEIKPKESAYFVYVEFN